MTSKKRRRIRKICEICGDSFLTAKRRVLQCDGCKIGQQLENKMGPLGKVPRSPKPKPIQLNMDHASLAKKVTTCRICGGLVKLTRVLCGSLACDRVSTEWRSKQHDRKEAYAKANLISRDGESKQGSHRKERDEPKG